ncbi:MAG: CHAT domain-containing protein [Novosphingobium sp.]
MSGAPIILAAFANDPDRFLESLQQESDAISDALRGRKDSGAINLEVQQGASIGRLFDLIGRYGNQLAVLHYGGHANGTALDLQAAGGTNAEAHGGGLAQLLGTLPALKLVFLNGCATQGHVEALLAAGVPAVIATSAPVEDDIALQFAREFYTALADPAASRTIDFAFTRARALVATAKGDGISFEKRGMSVGIDTPPVIGAAKWGLYAAAGKEVAFAWSLPDHSAANFVIDGAAPVTASEIATPSGNLVARQAAAVSELDAEFRKRMELERQMSRDGTVDERLVREGIINAFPSPIGEKLRILFAGGQMGDPRLRLAVATYDITTRFIAFALVAQLWDLFEDKSGAVTLSDDQWRAIEAFNQLDEAGTARFDFLDLAVKLTAVIEANGAAPYMAQCSGLGAAMAASDCAAAQVFMNEMRGAIHDGTVDPTKVADLAQQADLHLDHALYAMTFVAGYKLATIKEITINRTRRKDASFLHRRVVLDRAAAALYKDDTQALLHYADNESVILLKDLDDVTSYINLSPFVLDQNALTRNPGTNLYFMHWYDEPNGSVHYTQISEDSDQIEIKSVMPPPLAVSHPPMLKLYQEFRSTVARR